MSTITLWIQKRWPSTLLQPPLSGSLLLSCCLRPLLSANGLNTTTTRHHNPRLRQFPFSESSSLHSRTLLSPTASARLCFGDCLELHLRMELPYERGLSFDRCVCARRCAFCLWARTCGEQSYAFVSASN